MNGVKLICDTNTELTHVARAIESCAQVVDLSGLQEVIHGEVIVLTAVIIMGQFVHIGIVDVSVNIPYRIGVEAVVSADLRDKLEHGGIAGAFDVYQDPVADDFLTAAATDIILVVMTHCGAIFTLICFTAPLALVHIISIGRTGGLHSLHKLMAVSIGIDPFRLVFRTTIGTSVEGVAGGGTGRLHRLHKDIIVDSVKFIRDTNIEVADSVTVIISGA